MKVYEALATALVAEGVDKIFGVIGDGNMSLWGALGRRGDVELYSARNEAGAVAMADGYFRATQEVAVASVTLGPGITQAGTSLMCASRNKSAIVVVTGEVSAGDLNSIQGMDQRRFAEACGTKYFSVSSAGNLAEEIAEAFFAARSGRCPVMLGLPIDFQEKELDWDFGYHPSSEFMPAANQDPQDRVLDVLVKKLIASERPIIIAGLGARISDARDALVELGNRTGALLATSLQAKGLFAGEPFDIGIAGTFACAPAEELFADADLVIGVGAELGYYTSEGGLLFPSADIVRIDIKAGPQQIGVVPGLFVQGDARTTVQKVNARLATLAVQRCGFRNSETSRIMAKEWPARPRAGDGLDPRALMKEISKVLPSDVLVTSGVGHFIGFVAMYMAVSAAARIHFSLQFGCIGQTIPIAFGMGAGFPGRKHLVIEGDGSLMMNVQELESVARHKIPMVVLVMNDNALGAEVHKLGVKGFDLTLAKFTSPDFVALSRAFGGDGVRLDTEMEVGEAIRLGFEKGGLFVIDARVSPTTISDPYLKIHFGEPNTASPIRYTLVNS